MKPRAFFRHPRESGDPVFVQQPNVISVFAGASLWVAYLFALVISLCTPLSAQAEPRSYNAPEGSISSVLIFERGDFARVYGMFLTGVGRISYDDQTHVMDNLKIAFLLNSFVSGSPGLAGDLFGGGGKNGRELAFVQNEPVRLEGGKVNIKGDMIVNGIRRQVVFEGSLNKFGRINQSTDVGEDGPVTIGLSMHTTFKRSDFGMNVMKENSIFQDDVIIMFDIVAQR